MLKSIKEKKNIAYKFMANESTV